MAWIDNFFIGAKSFSECERLASRFRAKCQAVNVELHHDEEGMGRPLQRFEALGLEFDLRESKYRMSGKWVAKFTDMRELQQCLDGKCAVRGVYEVMGMLCWWSYSQKGPLCFLNASLSFFRRLARRIARDVVTFEDSVVVHAAVQREMAKYKQLIVRNPWRHQQADRIPLSVSSDASDDQWAFILDDDRGRQGVFGVFDRLHIFLKELYAVFEAIATLSATNPNTQYLFLIDNSGVVAALKKGLSSCYVANLLLQKKFTMLHKTHSGITPSWVSTTCQRADPYTRGIKFSESFILSDSLSPSTVPLRGPFQGS